MGSPVFLGLSALLWLPYGVFCFVRPGYLADAAGITTANVTAIVELRAMYGGLQAAIGALAGCGALRPAMRRPALLTLAFACAGLGLSRLLGGAIAGEVSPYTAAGLAFELTSAALAIWYLRVA